MIREAMEQARQAFGGWDNPMGTLGFDFLEFAGASTFLIPLFESLGFVKVGQHPHEDITLWQQGQLRFIVNAIKKGFSHDFAQQHGPCASAMAFRVEDAVRAHQQLLTLGARNFDAEQSTLGIAVPAIYGIGDSALYLIDTSLQAQYLSFFNVNQQAAPTGVGLTYLDHVTHNVYQGNMDKWAQFYERFFNFKQIRYFDIEGKLTGLKSRAMTSPCGNIRIPINESTDEKSQIVEYLEAYKGEGIQHIALGTNDIYTTVSMLRQADVDFLSVPDTYYEHLATRIPEHNENAEQLRNGHILIDGAPTKEQGLLLQIFTKNMIGPIFFEIIQRKGNEGFGEGNFKALFEAIERDQIDRGVLSAKE